MVKAYGSLSLGSSQSPSLEYPMEFMLIYDYVNEILINCQEIFNQTLDVFEQCMFETSNKHSSIGTQERNLYAHKCQNGANPLEFDKPKYSIKDLKPLKYTGDVSI